MSEEFAENQEIIEEVPVDDNDYYNILGVPRDATEKQLNIAYKKLSLKYNPDRHTDEESSEQASKRFNSITQAYEVLIDPTKRHQYDLQGNTMTSTDTDSVDVSSLGGLSRVFGAVINKLGIPIATQISADIVHTAQEICRNGGIEGGGPPLDPRVIDLPWGWGAENKVDRQAAAYYRLTVDVANSEKGFVINCRSSNKGKFKLIIFDKDGNVLHQEEAMREKNKSYTHATLFFTKFDTYRLDDSSSTDKTLPPIFQRLDSLVLSRKTIEPGQYLISVYGDNFIGKTNFSIITVPAKATDGDVKGIEEADQELLEMKKCLDDTKTEYIQAKAAFDAVIAKMKAHEDKVNHILEEREKHYTGFLDGAIKAFNPIVKDNDGIDEHFETAGDASIDDGNNQGAIAGVFGFLGNAATTATSVGSNAAQSATAATSWFARRLSLQLQSIIKPSSDENNEEVEQPVTEENSTSYHPVREDNYEEVVSDAEKKVVDSNSSQTLEDQSNTLEETL